CTYLRVCYLFVYLFDHSSRRFLFLFFFFFNDTPTTEIYTLSLHDALPIFALWFFAGFHKLLSAGYYTGVMRFLLLPFSDHVPPRSEEHTSELQSRSDLVCRLLLEKKKNEKYNRTEIDKTNDISRYDNLHIP